MGPLSALSKFAAMTLGYFLYPDQPQLFCGNIKYLILVLYLFENVDFSLIR